MLSAHCRPLADCRRIPLCECGCGFCVVHCQRTTMAGTSWLDEQLRLIEYWRERRTAFLAAQPAAVVLPLSGRGLLRLVAPERPRPVARAGRELAQATRAKVLSVLEEESGNRSAAARRLGIQISTLSRMLKRWGGEPGIREGAA